MDEKQETVCILGSLSCIPNGANWVATLKVGAGTESVDIEIGSINLGVILENDALKQEFIALMRKVVDHIVVFNVPDSEVAFKSKEEE